MGSVDQITKALKKQTLGQTTSKNMVPVRVLAQQPPNDINGPPWDGAAAGETTTTLSINDDVIRDDENDDDDDDNDDDDDDDKPVLTAAASIMAIPTKMEAFEIELLGGDRRPPPDEGTGGRTPETRSFDEDDDVFNDMENLLGKEKKKKKSTEATNSSDSARASSSTTAGSSRIYCIPCLNVKPEMTMGNVQVPSLYVYGYTGGWGVVGPHWFGPPCVVGLLVGATYYFAHLMCFRQHWYWTSAFCYYLSLQTLYFLLSAAYRDAGIVRDGRLNVPDPVPRNFRWCETCNYHQPPTTLHCPDCNACVLGFDHHCVWMGNCVGVGMLFTTA
jgi:DHHC palmitoyltransferase